jgi:hypothetical protein
MMFADADWLNSESFTTPSKVSRGSNSVQSADVTKDVMKSHHSRHYHSTGVIHETAKSQIKVHRSKFWEGLLFEQAKQGFPRPWQISMMPPGQR